MKPYEPSAQAIVGVGAAAWPIQVCLLGAFRLLQDGHPVAVREGGKTETLLCCLGLAYCQRIPRRVLTNRLWPLTDNMQANQSLNSLVYSLHKLIGPALGGAAPVLHTDGYYQLNVAAGIGVDVACFDAWADAGDQHLRTGDLARAADSHGQSVGLYRGDLCIATDIESVIERERLRARFLTLLAHLADYQYQTGDYGACLTQAWCLLEHDPCREDAHRVVMRCYVRRGERAAALHHYRVCTQILQSEFAAVPEPATIALFDQIRRDPSQI